MFYNSRNDIEVIHGIRPTDRTDPASEGYAICLSLPREFDIRARIFWDYLDDTAWLFEYKGELVVTDEALDLAWSVNVWTHSGPRFVCSTWEELEQTLIECFNDWFPDDESGWEHLLHTATFWQLMSYVSLCEIEGCDEALDQVHDEFNLRMDELTEQAWQDRDLDALNFLYDLKQ